MGINFYIRVMDLEGPVFMRRYFKIGAKEIFS